MLIGVVGAPNKGKSRLFSALTSSEVQVADYPFTTIEPNRGVALLRIPCAHVALGLPKCDARGGHCKNGVREIAVQLLDVAGLVPDAHTGKGMGNQFLDDLRVADGFLQVIDASGRTDLEGQQKIEEAGIEPLEAELDFMQKELEHWLAQVIMRNLPKFKHRGLHEMAEALSGLGYSPGQLNGAALKAKLDVEKILWDAGDVERFAQALYSSGKPRVVVANKSDLPGARERALKLQAARSDVTIVPASAAYEYALQKAAGAGLVDYKSGAKEFAIIGNPDARQKQALEAMQKFVKENGGTGVPQALEAMVFSKLGMMVAYPVEDENHYCNNFGEVLPDVLLLPAGTTAIGLAAKIHTDLAAKFIGAVDAKTKRRVGREHVLQFGDIIKIVAGR